MKVLLAGAHGMLGRALADELSAGCRVCKTDLAEMDITDVRSVKKELIKNAPDVVINCAGYTRVDDAELEPDLAMAINAAGPRNLAEACREVGCRLVHVSTDYVFDGLKREPYREEDPMNPIGAYGRSKALGEEAVREVLLPNHLVLRTSWMFGNHGQSFVSAMLGRYQKGMREFKVVNDQIGRPTYAPDFAGLIRRSVEAGLVGTYHAANRDVLTWYEFALMIFELAGARDVRVTPCATDQYPTRARRPAYSVLSTEKLEQALGMEMPELRPALASHLSSIRGG